jgi:lysine 2,3-aminomutase
MMDLRFHVGQTLEKISFGKHLEGRKKMISQQENFPIPASPQIGGLKRELAGENDEDPFGNRPARNLLSILPQPRDGGHLRAALLPAPETKHHTRVHLHATAFRRTFFPRASRKDWNDWRWQIQNRIRTLRQLEKILKLSAKERLALEMHQSQLPISVTPYFMSLLAREEADHPLRRTVIPTVDEFLKAPGESDDPLAEDEHSPLPGLVYRYPDRVLFLALDFCSTYCRYCTRSRLVGHGAIHPSISRWQKAIDYIAATSTIRDVLISGGDPLTLGDDRLEWLLARLRQIPHLEIIRIGTKIPAVLPQRVTPQLVRMLRKFHPLWISLHFTHPEECTPEAYQACSRLADAGIPLGSQTVLLKNVNDQVDTMKRLVHHLLRMRVRPYYLYQCDPISGSSHFRTPVAKGLEIIRGLRGFTSGYAVPTYVIDAPGGGGKIPLMPDYTLGYCDDFLMLRNYENRTFCYPDRHSLSFTNPKIEPEIMGKRKCTSD